MSDLDDAHRSHSCVFADDEIKEHIDRYRHLCKQLGSPPHTGQLEAQTFLREDVYWK